MESATEHLRGLARRVVAAALELGPVRAAMLVGSAARGDADAYSDLDLLLYVDELPDGAVFDALRAAVGATSATAREPTEQFRSEEFDLDGVRTEVSYVTLAYAEERLHRLLDGLEAVGSPSQKILAGVLEGLPLHGAEVVEPWRERLRRYPEGLRRAMIERHWEFFPLWYYAAAIEARDAELWRLDVLLEAAFNLLGVLAGLNRIYFARFELKRLHALVARMQLAPRDLADRLEDLFRLPPAEAASALGRLVLETQALVRSELPDLELPLPRQPGTRQQPWG
jgi:predicted nucleotidyltransferase